MRGRDTAARLPVSILLVAALSLTGCGGDQKLGDPADSQVDTVESDADGGVQAWPEVVLDPTAKAPAKLSMTGIARRVDGELVLHPEMVPYELAVPLFSDYAVKRRALWLPKGTAITWTDQGPLDFPVGSVVIKSFLFPQDMRAPTKELRLVETRVMVRGESEWKAWPYVWDADGKDASLKVSGVVKTLDFIDAKGEARTASYLVPQRNQCLDCHDHQEDGVSHTDLIGPKARNMNVAVTIGGEQINQLTHLAARGWLKGMPALSQVDQAFSAAEVSKIGVEKLTATQLNRAARDYLDINCAHCHSPTGVEGRTSQLYLNHDNDNVFLMGVCKAPSSAGQGGFGNNYDIVPGAPDKSILLYRLKTTELGAMMPDIGRSLVHSEGVELIRRWIMEMAPVKCDR